MRPLFNQAHQASGAQPRALAAGVLAYARHIDNVQMLASMATRIVNKHVALQVLPEHYPLVGSCLLASIREVLGAEVATDEVIAAWGVAYGQLADMLIAAETGVYAAQAQAPGGWHSARAFRVARKQPESTEITSFYFEPVDGLPIMAFEPGQYITLRLDIDGRDVRRNYSLSAQPDGRSYRISVKREAGGVASNYLHDHVHEGSVLGLFAPSGEFVLTASERPLVLISGGVGITPTLAMLERALTTSRPIYFIHCARDAQVHAFKAHVDALAQKHPRMQRFYCYSAGDRSTDVDDTIAVGRMVDAALLAQWLPKDADVDAYFLGSKPFMRTVKRLLATHGVPASQARYEFFGPASALDD